MDAAYVFRVRFTITPRQVRLDPEEFETTLRIPAPRPGEEGWLLFRNALWRGETGDTDHARKLVAERLPTGVEVLSADFREFETDEKYWNALQEAVASDLEQFNAPSARDALHKYFGSAVRMQ